MQRYVIRYQPTYLARTGLRTLLSVNARDMHETREGCVAWMQAMRENTGAERIAEIFGAQSLGTWRVDAVLCWYASGDAVSRYTGCYVVLASDESGTHAERYTTREEAEHARAELAAAEPHRGWNVVEL